MTLSLLLAQKIADAEMISDPVDHIVINDFCPLAMAQTLANEFGEYEASHWHVYSNRIEEKRTCNQWNLFQKNTYLYFQTMCSEEMNRAISRKFGMLVEADYGLHGGGQHIHSKMGNLNPHLDYSIHPKIGMERRLNAIYYLTDNYQTDDGGHFGLWGNSSSQEPGDLIKEYEPLFNRLVLFNTSQNSWHGLSRLYQPISSKYRKSLASYYVSNPRHESLGHTRAYFAPREDQKSDEKVLMQIQRRVDESKFSEEYQKK